jgi:hypothetical protein
VRGRETPLFIAACAAGAGTEPCAGVSLQARDKSRSWYTLLKQDQLVLFQTDRRNSLQLTLTVPDYSGRWSAEARVLGV